MRSWALKIPERGRAPTPCGVERRGCGYDQFHQVPCLARLSFAVMGAIAFARRTTSPKRRSVNVCRVSTHRSAGFTLPEVIVALAVLSLALGVLLNAIGNGLGYSSRGERIALAESLAQSLLAEVGFLRPLAEGQRSGASADGYSWKLTIQAFGDPTERQLWPAEPYSVAAQVFWGEGSQQRSYTLTTLRLGPKERVR
jgi:general secretion pathway protein I